MRNVASSVAVITAELDGRMHGMTATAVCSVTASPPTILIVVNRSNRSHPIISRSRKFTVNFLAEHQAGLGQRFSEKHEFPFDGVDCRAGRNGAPILNDTAAYIECETSEEFDVGTHTVFIGRVLDGDVTGLLPLLHHQGKYKSLVGLAGPFGTSSGSGSVRGSDQARREGK
ncbi:MAG TPA: flavin reductase family protein [Bradyrhizobium sp.]|nr:flavin reductase family protein [Bradyrhizobium sp.]